MYKYYYLYQITNNLNGKIYVGIHSTNDLEDGYMGSGTALKHAYKKYGIENFEKETLGFFDSEDDMFQKEIEIVDADFILREDTYNLTNGGNGGSLPGSYGVIKGASIAGKMCRKNGTGIFSSESRAKVHKYCISEENLNKLLEMSKKGNAPEAINKKKEAFAKIKHQQGVKNSQYGTMWITNGIDSKKISKEEQIPEGWKKGRVQKKK